MTDSTKINDEKAKAIILAVLSDLTYQDLRTAMLVDSLEFERYAGSAISHEMRDAEQARLMATIDTTYLQSAIKKILEG